MASNHHEIVTADYSLGLCFKVGGRNILFTGDTGWTFETSLKNEDFLKDNMVHTREEIEQSNIDFLISHIGTVTRDEFDFDGKEPIEDIFYNKHLGALGIIATVEQWKPNICIISEFGEELTHVRADMVKEIESTLKKIHPELSCIPGDVGLFAFLDSKTALCYGGRTLVPINSLLFVESETDGIKSIKYYSENSMKSLPPECKQSFIREMLLINGLQYYKKLYFDKIVSEYNFKNVNKNNLIAEFNNISLKSDPESEENYRSKVYNLLCALSTLIEDPKELTQILRENPYIVEVPVMLETYNLEKSFVRPLRKLTEICYSIGFGKEDVPLEEDVVKYYLEYANSIIDACLEEKYGPANKLLDDLERNNFPNK
jgi:hypothetical protein